MNRQKLLLFLVLILLIIAVGYAYFRTPRQKAVTQLKFASGGAPSDRTPREAAPKPDEKKLHLELLDRNAATFSGFKRNIFWLPPLKSTIRIPPPPPPPPPPPSPPPPPPPAAVPDEASVAKAEMAKFTFLGFLQKDARKTIFLSKDNEIILVKKGDRIAGRYEVANITDDVLTINSIPDGGQIAIPLLENMPLLQKKR